MCCLLYVSHEGTRQQQGTYVGSPVLARVKTFNTLSTVFHVFIHPAVRTRQGLTQHHCTHTCLRHSERATLLLELESRGKTSVGLLEEVGGGRHRRCTDDVATSGGYFSYLIYTFKYINFNGCFYCEKIHMYGCTYNTTTTGLEARISPVSYQIDRVQPITSRHSQTCTSWPRSPTAE